MRVFHIILNKTNMSRLFNHRKFILRSFWFFLLSGHYDNPAFYNYPMISFISPSVQWNRKASGLIHFNEIFRLAVKYVHVI